MDIENLFQENYEDEMERDKYIVFTIEQEVYAIHINYIIEIVGIEHITNVPDYPAFAKGVIDLRGDVIPIIDLRIIFNEKETVINKDSSCVISEFNENKYGLLVDRVLEVTDFGEHGITATPKLTENYVHRFIEGVSKVQDNIVMILDPSKVFDPAAISK